MSVIGKDRIRFYQFDSGLELFYRHSLILNFQEVLIASEARRFWLGCSNGGSLGGQQHAESCAEAIWSKRLRQKRCGSGRQTVASSLMSCSAVTSNTGMRMRRFSVCMYRIKSIP